MFTFILGFKNRDIQRLRRCLDSLAQQTSADFEAIVVDYGSDPEISRAVQQLLAHYPFCRLIFTETRGYPWNRAKALNIGIRAAGGDFIALTDADMIFEPGLVAVLKKNAGERTTLYCAVDYLPPSFTDWAELSNYRGRFTKSHEGAFGGLQCAPAAILKEIRGFDETYCYWGLEDVDLHHRLHHLANLEAIWLTEQTTIFHQWHPHEKEILQKYPPRYDKVPDPVWYQMVLHYELNCKLLIRNSDEWGRIHTVAERPVYAFVDLEHKQLRESEKLHELEYSAASNSFAARALLARFRKLEPGEALVVPKASFGKRYTWLNRILRQINHRISYRLNTEIDYAPNRMGDFLAGLVMREMGGLIADYYLDFPDRGGVSILVRGNQHNG